MTVSRLVVSIFCHVILVSIESLTKTGQSISRKGSDYLPLCFLFISILPGDTDVDEVEIVLCIAESFVRVNYNGKERRLQRVESDRCSGTNVANFVVVDVLTNPFLFYPII